LTAALQFAERLFVRAAVARSGYSQHQKRRTLIAAVNRCATQKTSTESSFSANCLAAEVAQRQLPGAT
jgi:hypothetical protein